MFVIKLIYKFFFCEINIRYIDDNKDININYNNINNYNNNNNNNNYKY